MHGERKKCMRKQRNSDVCMNMEGVRDTWGHRGHAENSDGWEKQKCCQIDAVKECSGTL